jgi:hypothetical protein
MMNKNLTILIIPHSAFIIQECPCHACPEYWSRLDGTSCRDNCPAYDEWLENEEYGDAATQI